MSPAEAIRLARRIMLTVRRGRVTLVDDTDVVQRAQIDMGPIDGAGASQGLRAKTPILQLFGLTGNPPAQSDAIVLAVGGDLTNAVAIATNHQDYRPKNLNPGDVCIYDIRTGQTVLLNASGLTIKDRYGNQIQLGETGIAISESTGNCVATVDATGIRITGDNGNLDVAGNLTAGNGVSATFTTPTGQTVTVMNGIVTNIV